LIAQQRRAHARRKRPTGNGHHHRKVHTARGRPPPLLATEDKDEKGLVTIRFLGGARVTTGSMHRVRTPYGDVLLECGLYQGHRAESERWNRDLPVNPGRTKAVVVSHGHVDHCGALPNLVRMGFRGQIHCTEATASLLPVMLMDSARVQESDVRRLNKKLVNGARRHVPLYTTRDVERTLRLVRGHPYGTPFQVTKGTTARFVDAGHIIGSAAVHMTFKAGGQETTLGFTGDLGRRNVPILRDPEPLGPVDWYVTESTYGNRDHEDAADLADRLEAVLTRTFARGGKVLIPAFAVGRTQLILYLLHQLRASDRIADVPIYVDSPMANAATEVFVRHRHLYDDEAREFLACEGALFRSARTRFVSDAQESRALNGLEGSAVIVSSSGMCEGGRILHHLRHHAVDRRNTVLFVGYQAEHTLGRRMLEGAKQMRIYGQSVPLNAEVQRVNGLSAHADRRGLLRYARRLGNVPKRTFLVHGDPDRIDALADYFRDNGFDGETTGPAPGEWHRLV
jgi:metallo-beta-lactamase family protein